MRSLMAHLMDQITKTECAFYYFYIKHLPFAGKTCFKREKNLQQNSLQQTQLTPQSNANNFFYAHMLNDKYNTDNSALRNYYG